MQYLVKTGGETRVLQGKTYVVNARTKLEAQQKANNAFCEEYPVINSSTVYTSEPSDRIKNAIIACVLMTIPIILSFKRWFPSADVRVGINQPFRVGLI